MVRPKAQVLLPKTFAFLGRKTPAKHFFRRMLKSKGWTEIQLRIVDEDEPSLDHEQHVDLLVVQNHPTADEQAIMTHTQYEMITYAPSFRELGDPRLLKSLFHTVIDELQLKMHNFFLESYNIPSNSSELYDHLLKSQRLKENIVWLIGDSSDSQFITAVNNKEELRDMNKYKALFPFKLRKFIGNPLKIKGMLVEVTVVVLVQRHTPLPLFRVFNQPIVSLGKTHIEGSIYSEPRQFISFDQLQEEIAKQLKSKSKENSRFARKTELNTFMNGLASQLFTKLCQKTVFTLALLAPHMRLNEKSVHFLEFNFALDSCVVPWLQRIDTATSFEGRGFLVKSVYEDALDDILKYVEGRAKESKKKRGKSQDMYSKDRLGDDLLSSSPDQLRSPRQRNTPQRRLPTKSFFNLTQPIDKLSSNQGLRSQERSAILRQTSMKAIPESRPPSTDRGHYKKRTSAFGSTRSTTLTPEETVKLRVHHEKQMRQMLRSLTPQRESYPLFLQYKRGDPNVLDNFLKKEGILPHREEPPQERKQRRSIHSLPSPFEYVHQNKVFRTDKALVVAEDLLHVKKDYLQACKELRKIVQRSPGSVYSTNTPSSLAQEYDSAQGPLTDRYFRGPGKTSPKRRNSKQEIQSYSATSLALSHNGKDLDAFIERNNCFEGRGVDKAWRKVKADYLKFIERRDPVIYKEGPTGDLVLESGQELKYEPSSIRNRQRQLAKLRKQDYAFKQEMKALHQERCKLYYKINQRRNGYIESEQRYTLQFPKLQEELRQQEQMILKEQNIELLGSDEAEEEKDTSEKDFTFNAGIRPCPPQRPDASFKRKYTNFVQKVQKMTQPAKKSALPLPKVAKTTGRSSLPQFRLNPDIKIAEKTVESCESTPKSKHRMSVFISSGFSAPRVYLTPRSKGSVRQYATPTGKKESSSSSNPTDRPPIPLSILMTMLELRKDRFTSFQLMFPFNEPTCRILMELLSLRPTEKTDHRNQQIKLLNLLLEELKKHTFNYFNKAISQSLLRPH